jgi:hypothetical protein
LKRGEKEYVAKGQVQGKGAESKHVTAVDRTVPVLKAQKSREIAEIIALMRSLDQMNVIEVSEATPIDQDSFNELMASNAPVILRQYAAGWDCVKNWSELEYLRGAALIESKNLPHRKYRQFAAKSQENGRLHLTDGQSKAKAVSVTEFLKHTGSPKNDDSLYLLGIHSVGSRAPFSYCPVQTHADDNGSTPPFSRDIPSSIPLLEWYADLLADKQKSQTPIKYDHQQFFLASGYAYTDLHYDSYDNFYVAVSGIRRWTLACPNASRWLIDSSSGKLKSGSSVVPHQRNFPEGSPAQIFPFAVVDLMPGDILFVPNCWWHLVESIPGDEGFSCAFNFFFSRNPDEVFGEFQAGLSATDSIVNELQTECRSKNAKDPAIIEAATELPEYLLYAPGNLEQGLWSQLLSLAPAHDIIDELQCLHKLHEMNSVARWDRPYYGTIASEKDAGISDVYLKLLDVLSDRSGRSLLVESVHDDSTSCSVELKSYSAGEPGTVVGAFQRPCEVARDLNIIERDRPKCPIVNTDPANSPRCHKLANISEPPAIITNNDDISAFQRSRKIATIEGKKLKRATIQKPTRGRGRRIKQTSPNVGRPRKPGSPPKINNEGIPSKRELKLMKKAVYRELVREKRKNIKLMNDQSRHTLTSTPP